eukprot:2856430-Pyramimonas_sp.AAC.1
MLVHVKCRIESILGMPHATQPAYLETCHTYRSACACAAPVQEHASTQVVQHCMRQGCPLVCAVMTEISLCRRRRMKTCPPWGAHGAGQ